MRIIDLINSYNDEQLIEFQYCFFDENLEVYIDSSLSYEGKAKDFLKTMKNKYPSILYLYASCGEAYDFQVFKEDSKIILQYIDFR